MATETEIKRLDLAMLYEIRLVFAENDKESYTKEEILAVLDQMAIAKK